MRLREALESCSTALLARIAREHGLTVPDEATRAELIEAIAARLISPGYLASYLAGLPVLERRVLEYVAGAGYQVRGFELERRVRQWASPGQEQAASGSSPMLGLLQRGLLFRAFVPTGPMRGEVYDVPEEARPFIQPARPHVELTALAETAEPAERPRSIDPAVALFLAASHLRRQGGRRLTQAAKELSEMAGQPSADGAQHWRLILVVAAHAGLLEQVEGRLLPSETIDDLLDDREAVRLRLWRSYLTCEDWNDVVESGLSPALLGRLRSLREVRQSVLDRLRALEPRRWYVVETLAAAFREVLPDVLRERYETGVASVLDTRTGRVWQGPGSWEQVEAPVLRSLLLGPLCWLGVLEQATDASGRPLVALAESGPSLLEETPAALRTPPQPAVLERDGTLRFPLDGHLAAMYRLEPYVRLVRLDNPIEYRLDQASLADGLARGGSLEDLQRHLATVLGMPLSDRVKQTLAAWSTRYGRVLLRPAVLLTVEDDELARTLLEAPELAPVIRERLGPRAARVRATQVNEAVERLRRVGVFPSVDASLRLMGGRGAYAGMVDERTLELLFVALEALRRLSPSALAHLANVDELRARLLAALGSERGARLRRLARAVAADVQQGTQPASTRQRARRRPAGGAAPLTSEA